MPDERWDTAVMIETGKPPEMIDLDLLASGATVSWQDGELVFRQTVCPVLHSPEFAMSAALDLVRRAWVYAFGVWDPDVVRVTARRAGP